MSDEIPIRFAGRRRPERRRLQNPNPQTRMRLMEASAGLLRECRFADLRVEDVAQRAGVSVGTFYLYFDGKHDLFVELVREFSERLRRRLADADSGKGPVRIRLMQRLSAYLDFVSENPAGFLHYRDGGAIDTNLGPLATWATKLHAADLEQLVADGIASGELVDGDPQLLSQALVGVIQHIAAHWVEHPHQHSREEIEFFLNAFIAYGIDAGSDTSANRRPARTRRATRAAVSDRSGR